MKHRTNSWVISYLLSSCLWGVLAATAAGADIQSGARHPVVATLQDGTRIEAELLATRNGKHVFFIGGTVIELPVGEVASITSGKVGEQEPSASREHGLYTVGGGQKRIVQDHAANLGRGVVMVKTARGAGTGWFINDKGYLVTNSHVVQRERSVSVTLFEDTGKGFGKRVFKRVRIVAVSDDIDLALLRIDEPVDVQYPSFPLASSNDVKVGDTCFTIGNPLGLERSTSVGEISSNSRQFSGRLFLQTTAPIAPGNSGGPLLNDRGEVIGVINMGAIFMDGIGFAIPVRYLREFLDNVEAFAYDPDNPNNGMQYMDTPLRAVDGSFSFNDADFIRTGFGTANLRLADLDGDGTDEVICVQNSKSQVQICTYRGDEPTDIPSSDDYEDINRLQYSRLFDTQTIPVRSHIHSLAVGDVNADGRPDLVYTGDIDGLSVLYQQKGGDFSEAVKIADLDVAPREESLRVADLDDNGRNDIFVLGKTSFTRFADGEKRRDYALNSDYRGRIIGFQLLDVNDDDLKDVLFLVEDRFLCMRARLQGRDGRFTEEIAIRGTLSGPVKQLANGGDPMFVALDKGANRVRRLHLVRGKSLRDVASSAPEIVSIPVDASESGSNPVFDFLQRDGRDGGDLLVQDNSSHEFVLCRWDRKGISEERSPSPRKIAACRLHMSEKGNVAVFCLSREDRLFGIAPVSDEGRVAFPRPLASAGDIHYMDVVDIRAGGKNLAALIWLEKADDGYVVKSTPASTLTDRVHKGGVGTVETEPEVLRFQQNGEAPVESSLANKPDRMVFADLNDDGESDLIVYWSYSGKETVYLRKDGVFVPAGVTQDILANFKDHPLVVVDLEGDNSHELLQVHPEFVRLLGLDDNGRIYVEKQFNWGAETINQLVAYSAAGQPGRFLVFDGMKVKWVTYARKEQVFHTDASWDLCGLRVGRAKAVDFDGDRKPDIIAAVPGGIQIFLNRKPSFGQVTDVVLDHDLEDRMYWDLATGVLDQGDDAQVLLYDSMKAMIEVYRTGEKGRLHQLLRHRLAERTILQYGGMNQKFEIPQGSQTGDINGDGKNDLVLILGDRLGVYLQ